VLNISRLSCQLGHQQFSYHFDVPEGQVLGIKGESGAGKTTLLNLIAGFEPAESGAASWQQTEFSQSTIEQRPVTMLFQDYNLFEHLTVAKNLELALPNLSTQSILTELARLKIDDHWLKLPGELSGGQRQRISLARAVLRDEPLLLLDEPFSELDDDTRSLCIQWLHQRIRASNKTVILVSHQLSDLQKLADRIATIEELKA